MEIGIDVGGTKTHIIVRSDLDEISYVLPTAQWCRGSLLDDPASAQRLVDVFVGHVPDPQSSPLVLGAHGCDNEDQRAEFERRMSAAYGGPTRAFNDAELLAPALGVDRAIAVVVGTGSIVTGLDAAGAPVIAGGYGALLGDPGSAPAIARQAVRAVLDSVDAGEPQDSLQRLLLEHFGVRDQVELALSFSTDTSITRWGSAAPLVFAAADEGSALADGVIEAGAAELALGVHRVRLRGALGDVVVVAGGVAVNQPRMFEHLSRHIRELEPSLDVRLLTDPPVRGALALAAALHPSINHMSKGGPYEEPQPSRI